MRKFLIIISSVILGSIVTGCQLDEQDQREPEMNETEATENESIEVNQETEEKSMHEINMIDREGIDIGTATFKEGEGGVYIHLQAHHLPEGLHGFHIHEVGLCEAPDFESAGGHFNPDGKNHGFDDPEGPHAGDMENIEVAADGTVNIEKVNDRVTLEKDVPHSLFHEGGTTLMIHADPDDYVSQPAGDAGERIACGVIGDETEE